MRQLPDARPPASRRGPWAVAAGALVLAAAAGVLLVPRLRQDQGTFVARGGEKVPWVQKVGVEVFVLGDALAKLEDGAPVSPGVGLVASYHNVDRAPAYLMVLGRDVRGELHWVYPGFEHATKDPESVRLLPLRARQVLPDSVALDDLPVGELELVCLITRELLRVSQIESLLPPALRNSFDLRTRFAGARVTSVSVRMVAPAPPPPPPSPQAQAVPAPRPRSAPPQPRTTKARPPRAESDPGGDWLKAIDPIPASAEGL